MSKRDFFMTYCTKSDLCAIYRYAMMDLGVSFENKPVWERAEMFEKWLSQPLDAAKWNEANDPRHRTPQT